MAGPVLFGIDPIPGESLMSLVTRVVARNILPSSHVILEQVGSPHAQNPTAAITPDLDEALLAHILKLPVAEIRSRRHTATSDDGFVDLFGSAVREDELMFRERRFSPTSIAASPHVRTIWSHKLVPFCAESWEYLVNQCVCGTVQRWRHAYKLDRCDRCCGSLADVPTKLVDPVLREDLSFILDMLTSASEHAEAREQLPLAIRDWNGGMLFELALTLMPLTACGYVPKRRLSIAMAEREAFAVALAQASRMIRSWPESFLSALENRVFDRSNSKENVRYTGIADYVVHIESDAMPECIRQLIDDALAAIRSDPGSTPPDQIGMREAALLTGQAESILAAARRNGLLKTRICLRSNRLMPTLDRTEIEYLNDFLNNKISHYRASTELELPQYAIRLLIEQGLLQPERHPYVLQIFGQGTIHAGEIARFKAKLTSTAAPAEDLGDSVPLHRLARAIGGGLKPWGKIFSKLVDGQIRFSLSTPSMRGLMVSQQDAERIVSMATDSRSDHWAERCSQQDAVEILNLPLRQIEQLPDGLVAADDCSFEWSEVLRMAGDCVTLTELSARTGIHATRLKWQLFERNLPPMHGIWWQRASALNSISKTSR